MPAIADYNDFRFHQQVDLALSRVETILDTTRTPRYAEDEEHTYDDKFGLAEFLTNTAIAAQANALECLGMDNEKIRKLHSLSVKDKRPVTLRFASKQSCDFVKEQTIDVESKQQFETEVRTQSVTPFLKKKNKLTRHKVVTKVTEYHWKITVSYCLFAFAGNDPENGKVVLQSREASSVIVTTGGKNSPLTSEIREPIDVSLTWLLQNIAEDSLNCSFSIDRTAPSCHTPRQNEEIFAAIKFFNGMRKWCLRVRSAIEYVACIIDIRERGIPSAKPESHVDINSVNDKKIFVPVLPLFENPAESAENKASSPSDSKSLSFLVSLDKNKGKELTPPLLPIADINKFLNEQCRSLSSSLKELEESFPPSSKQTLISTAEASLILLSHHITSIAEHFCNGVGYIEEMLRSQIVSAIGKEVQSEDFSEFILFHNRKLFKEEFIPKPFCHAIRRPGHFPDGVLSIEGEENVVSGSKKNTNPVVTFMRKIEGSSAPMFFPINAATSVEFTGERFLHAWICHEFKNERESKRGFNLIARARQFSSFLLLIGTVSGPNSFDPQHAIILQNKDEVLIPLLLNQLPTPREFRDAIHSLSPEQQRFAKAFRSMQLESSVFGVCAVQLKPQLEVLLGLPQFSLTKEIKLTQDLLSLFIDYQISSDLLSFDGDNSTTTSEKVGAVKGHVAAVHEMIEALKEKDLMHAEQEADMRIERSGANEGDFLVPAVECEEDFFEPAVECQADECAYEDEAPIFLSLGPEKRSFFKRIRGSSHRAFASASLYSSPAALSRKEKKGSPRCALASASLSAAPTPLSLVSMNESFASSGNVQQPKRVASASSRVFKATPKSHAKSESIKYKDLKALDIVNQDNESVDFTSIPKRLDAKFEALDHDSALRPTVIKPGIVWTKRMQQNLLTKMHEETLRPDTQKRERNKAFDLLDALSRSGSLPIACAELHVLVAATHCFQNSLMETVVQDNINPIEKMEKSMLIVASTIYDLPPTHLMKNEEEEQRVLKYSPTLFE